MARTLIAGNWKMNGLADSLEEAAKLATGLSTAHTDADCVICPPATIIAAMDARVSWSRLTVGGQTCHAKVSGAHTGDISAQMLADAGATHVIVGHSERRADHGETDAVVMAQAAAAIDAGLVPIICIGETDSEREAGETLAVIGGQLDGSVPGAAMGSPIVIAYEPIWAIGTGKTANPDQIGEVHGAIRSALETRFGARRGADIAILYGGSMKPANAADILAVPNVNGGLVGGASLKADDLLAIFEAAAR